MHPDANASTIALLRTLVEGVAAKTGEAFFASIVQHLAEALGVDYAVVGELADPAGTRVRTLAVWGEGGRAPNFVYDLEGTPWENVVGQTACCFQSGAAERFPRDRLLAELKIEGYAGTPLFDSKDQPLGILCVLSRRPLADPDTALQLLQIFAARTAAELERTRAEAALKRSEARYRSLFEGAVHGIYRSTRDGRLVAVNPALVQMLGYESAEALMARDLATDVYLDPTERERLIAEGLEHGIRTVETRWKKKDGTPITVRLSVRAVLNEEGTVEGFEGIVEDVTERRRLEEALAEARKMEAIARLAGGIAHDFNNLLTVIGGYAELLAQSFEPNDARRADAYQILEAAKRASLLTRQLLAFGRRQFHQPRVLDLTELVKTARETLARLAGEAVAVELDLPSRPVYVEVDPDQMEQVLVNLVTNARDAMPEGGRITVAVGEVEVHAFKGTSAPGLTTGRHALLSVTDSGPGIAPEAREHLFEPFFTTKEKRQHLGLGLATVYGIVRQSQGHIEVETVPGRGATFRIYLPRVEAPAAAAPGVAAKPEPSRGERTVLLVEDEPGVRRFARQVLERAGYVVLEAEDAASALQRAALHPGPVDLVLADIVLPGTDGFELASAVRRERPATPILFMSGYAGQTQPPPTLGEAVRVVQKPFTPETLVKAVSDMLRPPDPPARDGG